MIIIDKYNQTVQYIALKIIATITIMIKMIQHGLR